MSVNVIYRVLANLLKRTAFYEECDGILAYHIKKGNYRDIPLDGLNVLAIGGYKGNIWAGDGLTKVNMAIFFDDKADEKQREALNMIFSGKAAGFMAEFAKIKVKFGE
jgi:hypothetical protein